MTDTSLKNSQNAYNQYQSTCQKVYNYNLYKYKSISTSTLIPNAGINMQMIKNGYNNKILSNNACDIESKLFGIRSTNLVEKNKKIDPSINYLKSIKFFNTLETSLPNPLIINNNQRPKGPFC